MAKLQAHSRNDLRRSVTRKLRVDGFVPAVLYGKKTESIAVSVPSIEFMKTLREAGRNGIIDLFVDGDGKKHQVMVHDLQNDILKGNTTHIDFFEVDMKSELDADVAVNLVGDAPGEAEGGVLSHMLYTISVRALPTEIPESIEVDISQLGVGDSISVSDLKSGKNFEFNNDDEETVVAVLAPTLEDEGTEEEASDEPELVENDEASDEGSDDSEQ
ncbi:50S ribosomal protein L25/general stress protein Ctc [Geomicrobium sp. JCM 19038]|uniref:50S ribosomal protein L25/general stress protein Ctc n=1 Tax=Geomicrobium sp. JCM 19038 TaxID=1460635 RepID=UPI00045F104F|nr:50S ribosomal protein L25/general stress protein Ctc [Geomicrobium sp. JCM 19038]GAK09981.1 LSU ribosomal protein L25p [Geomicrobium sp. JCM 19038]